MRNSRLLRPLLFAVIALIPSCEGRAQTHTPFESQEQSLEAAADRLLEQTVVASVSEKPSPQVGTSSAATPSTEMTLNSAYGRVQTLAPVVVSILKDHGLPSELCAVILVESGGNAFATSPKGARGYWQLMPETARQYGLTVNGFRDDRTDLTLATHAAARYLGDLYARFHDWALALAAYNAGADTVLKARGPSSSRSFEQLASARALPMETRNYVPAVLQSMALFREIHSSSSKVSDVKGVLYALSSFAKARELTANSTE